MFTPVVDLEHQTQYQKQLWREAEQRHLAHIAQSKENQSPKRSMTKRLAAILTLTTLSR